MEICFATNNSHKLREVSGILPRHFRIVSLSEIGCTEELEETGDTFESNSLQKATYVFTRYGLPCFADDSGLEVVALGGSPGVYSARYAGPQRNDEDNIGLLLEKLSKSTDRRARFRTVITLIGFTPDPLFFEGIIQGQITTEKRGTNGFGYDPVFMPDGYKTTFAEMQMDEKNQISHRSVAVRKLTDYLISFDKDGSGNIIRQER